MAKKDSKKDSKYDDLGWSDKRRYIRDLAEDVGLDHRDYDTLHTGRHRPGSGSRERPDLKQLEKDISDRFANDYDVRRSMEYASELRPMESSDGSGGEASDGADPSGIDKYLKGMREIKGISNMNEVYDIHQGMKKIHKKELGNGGAFSSANDYAHVMTYLGDKVFDQRESDLDARFAAMEQAGDPEPKPEPEADVPSDRLGQAIDTVNSVESGLRAMDALMGTPQYDNSQFDPAAAPSSASVAPADGEGDTGLNEEGQRDRLGEAVSFRVSPSGMLGKYKLNLKEGLRPKA